MTLGTMFDYDEQQTIREQVSQMQSAYEKKGVHKKGWRYFLPLAEEHNLTLRMINQTTAIIKGRLQPHETTLDTELADLFGISRERMSKYTKQAFQGHNLKHYISRIAICKSEGGKNGGKNGSSKGTTFKRQGRRGKKI